MATEASAQTTPLPLLPSLLPKWSVHFAGSQQVKWALDEDLRWAQRALDGAIVEGSLAESRIVHSAWWPSAWVLGRRSLAGKQVVCFADNPPSLYVRQPEFLLAAPWIKTWIARSRRAIREFEVLGYRAHYAPYCADPDVFKKLDANDSGVVELRRELGIPADAYLVGNFHRDSEFSNGIAQPKIQKGPDVFLEIVRRAHAVNPRVHVLLAGPRRHWLRWRLREEGVPVYFCGPPETTSDDFSTNIIDRNTLNILYNLLDVCLISSRWEGGPHSVLEAAFSRTKMLSTPVGIAEDILESASLFETIDEGVAKLLSDAAENVLGATLEPQFERVKNGNQLEHLRAALLDVYKEFPSESPHRGLARWSAQSRIWADRLIERLQQFKKRLPVPPKVIGFLGEDSELALVEAAVQTNASGSGSGIETLRNEVNPTCRHYVVSSRGLEEKVLKMLAALSAPVVLGWGEGDVPGARATLVSSFGMLERLKKMAFQTASHPVFMPPIRRTQLPGSNEAIVEALSTVPEDAVEILLRAFAVEEFPDRVQWAGFR